MNTPTHVLLAGAALAKPGETRRNWAVIAGALIPDAFLFVFFCWAKFYSAMPEEQIWREAYWQEPWQSLSAISNSFPLALFILALGVWRRWPLVSVIATAMLIHLVTDIPVHADDAHVHFWPLTEWRFNSPLSYWDPDHYGLVVASLEAGLGIGLAVVLWRRFSAVKVRLGLGLALLTYISVPLYFLWAFNQV